MPSTIRFYAAAALVAMSVPLVGCSPAVGDPLPTSAAASAPAFPPVEYFGEGFADTQKALQSKPDQPAAPTF